MLRTISSPTANGWPKQWFAPNIVGIGHDARYAAQLACANWLGRLLLRRRIRREVAAVLRHELSRLASPYSLY